MRTHPAALTLPGENFPRFAIQPSETPLQRETSTAGAAARTPHGTRSARHCSSPGHNPGSLPRYRGGCSAQPPPSHFLLSRGKLGKVPRRRSGAAPAADTQRRTMNFCIAVLLVLQSLPGKAELEDDMEEIAQDLYDYMAHLSNYYSSTEDYYYDNITATPATYVYEFDSYETSTIGYMDWEKLFPEENATTEVSGFPDTNAPGDSRDAKDSQDFQESLGSSLQGHLTLIILLSFLGLLL
ncbi:uncharacterized protein LOC128820256 [Vidua macroura]|uniref:uncharacterized protein LOC128820256 n=1 Tax=Vidua macroura TaxID=187451 RepID=UPI0023A8B084|nr:uncharacterized protein LOC128820256 [Vidua macroura]XP_053856881.1 uncharacterized protein LOC128820256 [Vidua macroura]